MTFLNRNETEGVWKEWELQAYCIQELRRAGYIVAGDMGAGKRNPGKAKATGLLAGEPDMRVYLKNKIVLIELKTKKGRLSDEQKQHHNALFGLGHIVHVVWAENPSEAWAGVKKAIAMHE